MRSRSILVILGLLAAACGLISGFVAFDSGSSWRTRRGLECLLFPTFAILGIAWLASWWVRQARQDRNQTPGTQRCFSCGYSAEGLSSKNCPECGAVWSDSSVWGDMPGTGALTVVIVGSWFVAAVVGSLIRAVVSG